MKNFFKNRSDLGKLMMLIGVLMIIPTFVIPFFNEWKYFLAFFIPSISSILMGLLFCVLFKNKNVQDSHGSIIKRGSLTVIFAWLYAIFLGAVPFLFLGNLSFIQCLFEAASGWTTTGFKVFDVANAPQTFIYYCSFMQFCGGLGFILMIVMIMQNKHSMYLYNLEGHNDQLTTSVRKTARVIFNLYSGIFLFGVLLYIICGMPVFDSIVHCMSALSTGGFSAKAGSIGYYNSALIESVTILIMILGMTNFAVLLLLSKRKFKDAFKISEVKFMFIIFLVIIPIVFFALYLGLSNSFGSSVRNSIFVVVSILSTSGFATMNFAILPSFLLGMLILIMFIGGAAGSTSGGIKINRVYLLFRGAGISIKKKLSPEGRVTARYYISPQGKTEIDNSMLRDVFSYSFLYFLIFAITSLLLCLSANANLTDAIFEAASLSGTVGVSVGIFGPAANTGTLIIGIVGMIIARLEINIIVTGACSIFIRNKSQITD